MKLKNLSVVFSLLGLLLLGFSSCSDDDDNTTIDWGVITKTYTGENLTVNNTDSIKNGSIKVEGTSNETAKITLNNIVIGEPELSMNATLRRSGNNYTVEASNSNEDRDVSVKGTIAGNKMTATVTTKIKSPIVGTLALKDSLNSNNVRVADVVTRLEGGVDFMIQPILNSYNVNGEGLAKAVEYVNAYFNEDGTLDIRFKTTQAGSVEMSTAKMGLNFYYYNTKASTNKVYIAFNKELLNMLIPILNGALGKEIDPAVLAPLFVDAGNYYAVPLNFKNEGNYTQFYISKDYLQTIVKVVNDLGLIPDQYSFVVEWIQDLNSDDNKDVVIDLGLGFNKK